MKRSNLVLSVCMETNEMFKYFCPVSLLDADIIQGRSHRFGCSGFNFLDQFSLKKDHSVRSVGLVLT